MKMLYGKWIAAIAALFALFAHGAYAADATQTINLSVPVEINWPESDVAQAFAKGPPYLRCEIHSGTAPSNPTSSQWLALGLDKPLGSASQPLMVDSSGHYSGKVSFTFTVPASTQSLSYWCYLAPSDTRATYLNNLASGRGLKVENDQGGTWQTIKK